MSRDRFDSPPGESSGFVCLQCGFGVSSGEIGTRHRNHCPRCLYSLHVDLRIGDRLSECKGLMEPIGIWVQADGEWSVLHRCTRCGLIRANRIAGDDNEAVLLGLAARPLSSLPFPIDVLLDAQLVKGQRPL